MIPYKTISEKWEVIPGKDGNVLRPVEPFEHLSQEQILKLPPVLFRKIMSFDDDKLIDELSLFTSLPVGHYQAEDLPEAVWQYQLEDGSWHDSSCNPKTHKGGFEEYRTNMLPAPSRQLIPSK